MLKIAICDDNNDHLRYTAELVKKELTSYPTEIILYTNAKELTDVIRRAVFYPDIAILDIVLEEQNGIDIAKEINRMLPSCRIIFLTGYGDYASASYEAEHVWFIQKSAAETYIGPALQKALTVSADFNEKIGILAKTAGKRFFLPLGKVLYLDRVGRKTRIICTDYTYSVSGSPQSLITDKLEPYFIHCHQGYWINIKQITALEKNEFVLTGNHRIPISRSYREEARSRFFTHLAG